MRPRSIHPYGLSIASVLLSLALWLRAKTIGEDERDNADRPRRWPFPSG